MTFRKLLEWTIADALDEVWSKSGVSPSKQTRKSIIKAAEKISQDLDNDFITADKESILLTERWADLAPLKNPLRRAAARANESNRLIETNHEA